MRRPTAQPHLESRPTGYYWRRRWPRRNRCDEKDTTVPDRFLGFALRTDVLPEAKDLAARLTRMSDTVFFAPTEKTMPIARTDAERLLAELIRFEIAAFEQARAVAPARSRELAIADQAREEALLAVLRDAFWLRDREVARAPLRAVAARLGIALDESDPDWAGLAVEATRALIDICEERMRRDRGHYDGPTPLFRAAVRASNHDRIPAPLPGSPTGPIWAGSASGTAVADMGAHFASARPATTAIPAPPLPVDCHSFPIAPVPASAPGAPHAPEIPSQPDAPGDAIPGSPSGSTPGSTLAPLASTAPTGCRTQPIPYPGGMTAANATPGPFNALAWPGVDRGRLNVDVTKLSARCQNALLGDHPITLSEGADLYLELKLLGYQDEFDKKQKIAAEKGQKWRKTSLDNRSVATRIWLDLLGDRAIDELNEYDVEDVVGLIARLPAKHGKAWTDIEGYRDIIEHVDRAEEHGIAAAEAQARNIAGLTAARRAEMLREKEIRRVAVDTFLRHVRTANTIGTLVHQLGRIKFNPFWLCSYTTKEAEEMKKSRGNKVRVAWDDRIFALYRSRKFQEPLEDVGEPLFWAPLMAHHMGFRMEEVLQLGPEDFSVQDGIHVVHVHGGGGNSIKSPSADRLIPVHPNLVELGLLQLVELRRTQGEPRLFPNLCRGQFKNSYAELFTKAFGYYRRTNEVYWLGLDFHALRTTFHQRLQDNSVPGSIRRRLMGHTPLDEGEKSYSQSGISIRTLYEHVAGIEVDISMVRRPFAPQSNSCVVNFPATKAVA